MSETQISAARIEALAEAYLAKDPVEAAHQWVNSQTPDYSWLTMPARTAVEQDCTMNAGSDETPAWRLTDLIDAVERLTDLLQEVLFSEATLYRANLRRYLNVSKNTQNSSGEED